MQQKFQRFRYRFRFSVSVLVYFLLSLTVEPYQLIMKGDECYYFKSQFSQAESHINVIK